MITRQIPIMAIDYFSKTGGTKEELADLLKRKLEWLYRGKPECKCDHGWCNQGRQDGIDMGYGFSRTSTHPYCPHHGTAAVAEWKRQQKEKRSKQHRSKYRDR